ncbi:MAG: helix-turn-helix transcriptional regulator [Albidovulum sp.]|nr:helix-turn-helix transcriptional regulator [Albidovulum sp.]
MDGDSQFDLSADEAARMFSALGSKQRLVVLRSLVRAGPEGITIGELGQRSGIEGSTLTHHLNFLARAGLVLQEKRGRSTICAAADYDMIKVLSDFLLKNCCTGASPSSAKCEVNKHVH